MTEENACVLDIETGKQAGLKIQVDHAHVTTWVGDSEDAGFRECTKLPLQKKMWGHFFMILAAKNFQNEKKQ